MSHYDMFLAGLSIEERNEVLDQLAAEEAAEARAEEAGAWRVGGDRWEANYFRRS